MTAPNCQLLMEAGGEGHVLQRFYPQDYTIEPDHKGREWRDVALIPFIDLPSLLTAVAAIPTALALTPEEEVRNSQGAVYIYISYLYN